MTRQEFIDKLHFQNHFQYSNKLENDMCLKNIDLFLDGMSNLSTYKHIIIAKPRQSGVSSMLALFVGSYFNIIKQKKIIYYCPNIKMGEYFLDILNDMFPWMIRKNKLTLENVSVTVSLNNIRADLIIADEVTLFDNQRRHLHMDIENSLNTNGKSIIVGTPYKKSLVYFNGLFDPKYSKSSEFKTIIFKNSWTEDYRNKFFIQLGSNIDRYKEECLGLFL